MLYMMLLIAGLIVVIDILELLKDKKKNLKTIILISTIITLSLIFTGVIQYMPDQIPTIGNTLNETFKQTLPSFYKFMAI